MYVSSRRLRGVALAAVMTMSIAACGDDGDGEGPPVAAAGGDGPDVSAGDDEGPEIADGGTDDGGGEERFECAVTAEQVSEVLGADLEKNEETCTFTRDGLAGSLPSAGFLVQLSSLCNEEFATQTGYTEQVEGLGVEAFLRTGGGATARILVCADAAFEVFVDTGTDTVTGVAAAETLALVALEG